MSSVMATESPIRILEGADKLPPFKQSTRYGPSSVNMAFEDLGLFLKGQNFQSLDLDLDLDVIPSRTGSAPPSMEGSGTAVESIFSKQKSTLNPISGYPNISTINSGRALQGPAEPSSYSAGSSISLSQSVDGPLNSCDSSNPFQPSGDTTCDWQTTSHNSLPVHVEEFEEDRSSEQSSSVSVETAALMSHHNGPLDSTQEDLVVSKADSHARHSCSISSSPQNERDSSAVTVDVPNNNLSTSGVSNVDCSSTSGSHNVYKKEQPVFKNKMLLQQAAPQEGNTPRVQGSYSQIIYPGISQTYGSLNQFHYGSSRASAAMVQPLLQSSGFTPPLYAAAALMTSSSPFYPNLNPVGFFPSQYDMGGYTFNSSVSPTYMAGYPPHRAVPVVFNSASFPTSGVSGGGSVHAYEMQNLQKFYSQIYPFQHFPEPFHLQYSKPSAQDSYGIYGHRTPTDGAILTQINLRDPKKEAELAVSSNNHKHLHSSPAGSSNLNLRRDNVLNHHSYGTGGFPGASVACPNERYYISHPHSSSDSYKSHGLQNRSSNDTNLHALLEELKAGKGQRFELSDLSGYISEFSVDQHGSRFVQQRLETCSVEEKASVFKEVIPHASELMNDVFGNYVIQKLFEYGSPEQRKDLADQLEGQILPLSLQMYGCRVIQKALDVIDLEQKERLIRELDGHVTRCVRDQNGNHVIQKCIESIPSQNINFLISSFRCQVATLSMHPYGCRVIQRVLEHCKDESQSQFIVDEILDSFSSLAQDQYGNYVTQYVLERSKPREIRKIIDKVSKSIVQLSQHKFASNVVEKCVEYSDSTSRDMLVKEIIGHGDKNDNLWIMMKDQYANYVIQKIIHKCTSNQRELLLGLIRSHFAALKKYTYGKHIVARFEELCGEEIQTDSS